MNKMERLSSYVSIVTISVKRLNSPNKRHTVVDGHKVRTKHAWPKRIAPALRTHTDWKRRD